jgi:hypothetical protein
MTPSSKHRFSKRITIGLVVALTHLLSHQDGLASDYRPDIGYVGLQNLLGVTIPTGAGVRVTQVEAAINDTSGGASPIYMPDPTDFQFIGKTITSFDGNPSGSYSAHATSVGGLFYGDTASIAPGVTQIDSFDANGWVNSLYNATPGPGFGAATVSPSRIANHSWVGGGTDPTNDGTILRLVDRQVSVNEYIQVVAAPANNLSPLLGSAYNVITVGRTDGVHDIGSHGIPVDGIYTAGRAKPDLVAPMNSTSGATPLVSATAALLVQTGHEGGLTLSHGSTTIAGIGTIHNAERSETVKATLMAGADRETANTSTQANITDYRSTGHQTANGLDARYGAGQVNVLNSYRILAGGEQSGAIGAFGFDYNGAFGGLNGSSRAVSYSFTTSAELTLFATLSWNIGVSNTAALTTTLYNLDLSLLDVGTNIIVASSASLLDNTENLWVTLLSGTSYEMRVTTDEASNFLWDYSLAWRMEAAPSPVPLPAAVWLFVSGLAGLARLGRRRPSV